MEQEHIEYFKQHAYNVSNLGEARRNERQMLRKYARQDDPIDYKLYCVAIKFRGVESMDYLTRGE